MARYQPRTCAAAKREYAQRNCAGCLRSFTPHRRDQACCSLGCKRKADSLEQCRGREVYRLAYHWRKGAGKGLRGSLMGEISQLVDRWRREDAACGRPAPGLPGDMRVEVASALNDLKEGYEPPSGSAALLRELRAYPPAPENVNA